MIINLTNHIKKIQLKKVILKICILKNSNYYYYTIKFIDIRVRKKFSILCMQI